MTRRRGAWALLALIACPPLAQQTDASASVSSRQVSDLIREQLSVGGQVREYYVHLPAHVSTAGLPLVLAFHGGGGRGKRFDRVTQFTALSDSKKFVVVYPESIDRHWNDGRPEIGASADDVGFVRALIDKLTKQYSLDPKRVYATGISNGGLLSFRLACEIPEKLAGIAPVAANLGENVSKACRPERAVPVLNIVGESDPIVPISGGVILNGLLSKGRGRVISSNATMAFWRTNNHCLPTPSISETANDAQTGTRVRKESYQGCAEGASVIRYLVLGGGHTWPSGPQYLPTALIGKTTQAVHASEEIIAFFLKHHR